MHIEISHAEMKALNGLLKELVHAIIERNNDPAIANEYHATLDTLSTLEKPGAYAIKERGMFTFTNTDSCVKIQPKGEQGLAVFKAIAESFADGTPNRERLEALVEMGFGFYELSIDESIPLSGFF